MTAEYNISPISLYGCPNKYKITNIYHYRIIIQNDLNQFRYRLTGSSHAKVI